MNILDLSPNTFRNLQLFNEMLRRNCSDVCTNLRVADTAVPRLLALGLSVEQVASALELEVKQVRAIQNGT